MKGLCAIVSSLIFKPQALRGSQAVNHLSSPSSPLFVIFLLSLKRTIRWAFEGVSWWIRCLELRGSSWTRNSAGIASNLRIGGSISVVRVDLFTLEK